MTDITTDAPEAKPEPEAPADTPLLCFGCVVERHTGQRQHANPAATIVNGQATCLDHLQLVDGPVIPGRTASGLILGNGN